MRIISLAPFLTEAVVTFGLQDQLVAVSSNSSLPKELEALPRIEVKVSSSTNRQGSIDWLADFSIDESEIRSLAPDIILTSLREEVGSDTREDRAKRQVMESFGSEVKLYSYYPRTLNNVQETFETLGRVFKTSKGRDISQRLKAQLMNWSDNFYERMKNKRVSFISSVDPLMLGGLWLPDMIEMCSAISQVRNAGGDHVHATWSEVLKFRPDVIVVAPESCPLREGLSQFKVIEKFPDWETLPAVKRGEVVFTDGNQHFYTPSPHLIESMSILISAIAGFDSGYIAPRDSFYRLRWLEMQRHKF